MRGASRMRFALALFGAVGSDVGFENSTWVRTLWLLLPLPLRLIITPTSPRPRRSYKRRRLILIHIIKNLNRIIGNDWAVKIGTFLFGFSSDFVQPSFQRLSTITLIQLRMWNHLWTRPLRMVPIRQLFLRSQAIMSSDVIWHLVLILWNSLLGLDSLTDLILRFHLLILKFLLQHLQELNVLLSIVGERRLNRNYCNSRVPICSNDRLMLVTLNSLRRSHTFQLLRLLFILPNHLLWRSMVLIVTHQNMIYQWTLRRQKRAGNIQSPAMIEFWFFPRLLKINILIF